MDIHHSTAVMAMRIKIVFIMHTRHGTYIRSEYTCEFKSKSKYRTIALTVALFAVQTIEIHFRMCTCVCVYVSGREH